MNKLTIIFLVLFNYGNSISQVIDSVKKLKTFEKTTSKLLINDVFLKANNLTLKNDRHNESISTIIEQETTTYIKSYSPGNLSSISIRGGNSQQTSLVYNDFILNNPLNGIVDLSMFPSVFFNSVNIMYGIPTSNWGNGGLSGAINLENKNSNQSFLEIGNNYGSFNQNSNYLKANFSNNKIFTSFKIYRLSASNNFRYQDYNNEYQFQENSSVNQLSFMTDTKIKFPKTTLDFTYFGQIIERQIPKTVLEANSNAFQTDKNHRIFLSLKKPCKNHHIEYKTAFYREINTYNDSLRFIFSYNPCNTLLNQIILTKTINSFNQFKINLTHLIAKSSGNNFSSKVQINRLSLNGIYKIKQQKKRINHLFNARVLIDNNYLSPLTFSYSFNKKILKNSEIYINFGKVYRFPTINDLYWFPGGNLDLQPENGFSLDFGGIWKIFHNNIILSFEPTIYSRWIDNWILWQPSNEFWTPLNIKSVWNRGIETSSNLFYQLEKGDVNVSFKTAYNLSTNQDSYSNNDDILGKQLIYAPHYKFIFKAKYTNKKLSFTYLHNYTGYRFTSNDNSNYLPSFNLGSLYFSYEFLVKENYLNLFYKIHNLYNNNYQLIINRPMPMINHELGFNFKINK